MLYITIVSLITSFITFFTDIWKYNMPYHSGICRLSPIIFVLSFFIYLCFNENSDDNFEIKTISVKKEEKSKRQIFPLDMTAETPNKFFIIPQKDEAYHLYVKNDTGFEKVKFSTQNTTLKQCDKENPMACVVETLTTTTKKKVPKYKKFLYHGIVFWGSTDYLEYTEEETTYTLYLPENAVIQ